VHFAKVGACAVRVWGFLGLASLYRPMLLLLLWLCVAIPVAFVCSSAAAGTSKLSHNRLFCAGGIRNTARADLLLASGHPAPQGGGAAGGGAGARRAAGPLRQGQRRGPAPVRAAGASPSLSLPLPPSPSLSRDRAPARAAGPALASVLHSSCTRAAMPDPSASQRGLRFPGGTSSEAPPRKDSGRAACQARARRARRVRSVARIVH
jgi:hypothetical protein